MSIIHRLLKIKPGREDWEVKTGIDADAGRVLLTPHPTTVEFLAGLPAPHPIPSTRVPPTEFAVYQVDATLSGFKEEADGDVHCVLTGTSGATVIAEIPYPAFVKDTSPFKAAVTDARTAFEARYQLGARFTTCADAVTVTGVGFFDKLHGQTGVAPNGIELHPVLSITFKETTA